MALPRSIRFRADDIWDTPDDGRRYEVLDGQLYMTPPPVLEHQGASGELYRQIANYVVARGLGKVYSAPVGVVLDDENGLQPDLVYVSRERSGLLSKRGIEGAPDLVVEILSPSTRSRDRGIKMRRYAAVGVRHYWIVDPQRRVLEAHELTEQGYELTGSHGPGSIFRPRLFPGLEIAIDELWA